MRRSQKRGTIAGMTFWIVSVAALLHMMVLLQAFPAEAAISFNSEETVQAGGLDIDVPGYSVPSFVDWDNDGKNDLVVGEGASGYTAKVRVYLNIGTTNAPQFSTFSFVQSGGGDLKLAGSGCMGLFPRVVYWDADNRKDLLVGQTDGLIRLYLNTGTDGAPSFDGGVLLLVGNPGSKSYIDVGYRATPVVVDWNNDGKKDIVAGAYDGFVHLFINEGTDVAPDFRSETYAQDDGIALDVPTNRSSPAVVDFDRDGRKDILAGNTEGQLLFYSNMGTDTAPTFSGYSLAESNGVAIDLMGTVDARSRPFVCDWTGDGLLDVLIGGGDGMVHLYQSVPEPIPGDANTDQVIDKEDAAILATNWLQAGVWAEGDFNNDGLVNDKDATLLAANWGQGLPASVPEPTTITLLLCGLASLTLLRRRW